MKCNFAGSKVIAWLLIFSTFAITSSCRKETPQTGQGPTNTSVLTKKGTTNVASGSIAKDPNAVAVTVDGKNIYEKQVQALISTSLAELEKNAGQLQLPPAAIEQYRQSLRQQALDQLILTELLGKKVKDANIVITDAQVLSEINTILAAQQPPMTLDEYKKELAKNGINFEEEVKQLKEVLGYQKLFEPYWAGKINITEADANSYYTNNIAQFKVPEQVRASHILVSIKQTDPNKTAELIKTYASASANRNDPNDIKKAARAKIEALLAKIKAGTDFAELAKTDSDDPGSAKNGGDLDFFAKGRMVEPFDEAAFKLKTGEISDIVETAYGYHIIKVTDHKDAETVTFEKAKDQIINSLKSQKQGQLAQEYFQTLKSGAKIVYPPGTVLPD